MGERKIENLDQVPPEGGKDGAAGAARAASVTASESAKGAPPAKAPKPQPEPQAVDFHYPDPTPLAVILRDVARWSHFALVMEPGTNTKIQIFAPRKLSPKEAWELFLTSLSVVNLRAVQVGAVVKIVPVTLVVSA